MGEAEEADNMAQKNTESDFWLKVEKSDNCWEWKGNRRTAGYGVFQFRGKACGAHRMSFFFTYGEIPKGMCVCHKCDNPPCVNPSHLFLGTYKDNAIDMVKKGRHVGLRKLTLEQVKEIRAKFQSGNFKRKELAALYKITLSGITQVIRKTRWINV